MLLICLSLSFYWLDKLKSTLLLFSHLVVSDSLWPHGLQYSRLLYPSPSPRVCSNSLSQWCHPTISSSVTPFSFCLQSFPESGYFSRSWFFASGGQCIGASATVLQMNIQGWFPLGLTGLIFLQTNGLSRVFSNTSLKASILWCSAFFMVQLSHLYMTTGKTTALTRWTFVGKVMSLFFNRLSRSVLAFLLRSKCLNFMAAVTICSDFGAPKKKVWHCFHCFSIYFPWSDGTGCCDLSFFDCWVLSLLFHSPLSLSPRGSLVPLRFLPQGWCHLHIWGY